MFFEERFIYMKWQGAERHETCGPLLDEDLDQCLVQESEDTEEDLMRLEEEFHDSGFLVEHLAGDSDNLPFERHKVSHSEVSNITEVKIIEHGEGVYFYEGKVGQSLEDIFRVLSTLPQFDYLDHLFGLGVRSNEHGFSGIPSVLPYPMIVPIPSDPNERMISDEEFITRYAGQAIDVMSNHEYYGPYIKYLACDETMRENLMAVMLAVAKGETGVHYEGDPKVLDEPIGKAVFSRYEPKEDLFSYSCFHILMDEVGETARQNLNMTEGQTYHYYNACCLFLAYLVEKSRDKYLTKVLDSDEKVQYPPLEENEINGGKSKEEYKSEGIVFSLPAEIDKEHPGPTDLIKKSCPDILHKIASPLGRRVEFYLHPAKLQREDSVGAGIDDEGPFAIFCDADGNCSGKLRVLFNPMPVMEIVEQHLPDGDQWDAEGFRGFYGAAFNKGHYTPTLEQNYARTIAWIRGEGVLPEQNLNHIYYKREFKNSSDLGGVTFQTLGSENVLAITLARNARTNNDGVLDSEKKYGEALGKYIETLNPPRFLKNDQVGLKDYGNGEWRLIYCRDRHCEMVPLPEDLVSPLVASAPQVEAETVSETIDAQGAVGGHLVERKLTVLEGASLYKIIRGSDPNFDMYLDGEEKAMKDNLDAAIKEKRTWGSAQMQPGDELGFGFRDPNVTLDPNDRTNWPWDQAYLVLRRPDSDHGTKGFCTGPVYVN
jgi:hypothetical protein